MKDTKDSWSSTRVIWGQSEMMAGVKNLMARLLVSELPSRTPLKADRSDMTLSSHDDEGPSPDWIKNVNRSPFEPRRVILRCEDPYLWTISMSLRTPST